MSRSLGYCKSELQAVGSAAQRVQTEWASEGEPKGAAAFVGETGGTSLPVPVCVGIR